MVENRSNAAGRAAGVDTEKAAWVWHPPSGTGSFHHQLHHRFYDCNYGNPFMPWDKWLGTNHDGTQASMAEIRRRRRARHKLAESSA